MYKKYVVRLSDEELQVCQVVVEKLKGSSQKVRRAQILLKADADGPNWTDARIAEAYHCRVQTIENLRKRLVTEGFETALNGMKRESPSTPPLEVDDCWLTQPARITSSGCQGWSTKLISHRCGRWRRRPQQVSAANFHRFQLCSTPRAKLNFDD